MMREKGNAFIIFTKSFAYLPILAAKHIEKVALAHYITLRVSVKFKIWCFYG